MTMTDAESDSKVEQLAAEKGALEANVEALQNENKGLKHQISVLEGGPSI